MLAPPAGNVQSVHSWHFDPRVTITLAITLNKKCSAGEKFRVFAHCEAIAKLLRWKMAVTIEQFRCNTAKLFRRNTNVNAIRETSPRGIFACLLIKYRKRRKFGVAKVWRIDKIRQTFIRQLTTRPRDVLLISW